MKTIKTKKIRHIFLAVLFLFVMQTFASKLGIVYGVTYVKSKSIIYPMIMHGLSDVFMVGIGYIFMIVMI